MKNYTSHRRVDLLKCADKMDVLDITIFVPCRNEQGNVGRALDEIVKTMLEYSYTYEIIVIDDASTDGSVAEIENVIQSHKNIRIVLKKNIQPLGVSYNFVDAAILGNGKYFRMIGGHFQDRREAIMNVFDNLGKADIIISYMEPDYRRPLRQHTSRTYTKLVNLISGYNISHYHGTPLHRRIDIIRWHSYRSVGFYADLTTRLLDEGITYLEVPTVAYERELGKSLALRWRNVVSLLVGLADMFLRRFSKERVTSTCVSTILSPEVDILNNSDNKENINV
ncbi:MAG: glycosyltransferase [Legionellaceae bacterium]|nr:glycosyltransferase [Legionellaceae bacterium]